MLMCGVLGGFNTRVIEVDSWVRKISVTLFMNQLPINKLNENNSDIQISSHTIL